MDGDDGVKQREQKKILEQPWGAEKNGCILEKNIDKIFWVCLNASRAPAEGPGDGLKEE